jgi:LysM repeat protein
MNRLRAWGCAGWLLLFALLGSGCFPVAESDSDEKKDPYYLAGRSKANAMDYQGALEAFEKALEANPHSAAAHYELGVLQEQRFNNYPAAIYHYEKFLKLNPKSPQAQFIAPRIEACNQEIAKSVSFGPVTEPLQREVQRLAAENLQLRHQLAVLQTQAMQLRAALDLAATNPLGRTLPPFASPGPQTNALVPPSPTPSPTPPAVSTGAAVRARPAASSPSRPSAVVPRRHVVRSGETFYAIARRYGLPPDALLKANPGMDPRRLKVGQSLVVPTH